MTNDRINLFNSKKTALDLTIGRKWVRESYKGASGDDENNSTSNIYHATLTQFVSPKLTAWTGYYREDLKNSLYDYGSYGLPDMARELRTDIYIFFTLVIVSYLFAAMNLVISHSLIYSLILFIYSLVRQLDNII